MARRNELLAWVEARVAEARRIALRSFRSASLRVERKPDGSPVTAADRRIETHLRRAIQRAFRGEEIVGEEFGGRPRPGSTYWTLDPIDGTRAFSCGLPSWGILVGRVERGRPVLAVCDFPAIPASIGVAPGVPAFERSGGRVVRFKRARRAGPVSDLVLFHGGSRWWHGTPYERGFRRLMQGCFLERAYGDCFGYLWVLRGRADAMLDYACSVWDLAPLSALAEATGRVLVDCQGRARFTGPSSIFAHPELARRIVATLRARR